jgi:preprotein translocase subunit SecA
LREAKEWTENHEKVVEAGGLHILGTERHESRRIDNQLRGRSGRQGDPGSSRFYLSLEDELMRLFASERIANIMQKLGMEEGQEIESNLVSKAIASAQKRVEGRNFDIRKHLLEYDDVMNSQRNYIYADRNELLDDADVSEKIKTYIQEVVQNGFDVYSHGLKHSEEWDVSGMKSYFKNKFSADFEQLNVSFDHLSNKEMIDKITDGIINNFHQMEEKFGQNNMRAVERLISLQVIDTRWKQHLLDMDQLRDGIWTLGYGEKNPLVEYKLEGFRKFKNFLVVIKEDIIEYLTKVQIRNIEETRPAAYNPVGEEYHAEAGQFGSNAQNLGAATRIQKHKQKDEQITVGGNKRKSSRRGRR